MEVHHIGIVTPDSDAVVELFTELLGGEPVHEEGFEGLRVVFVAVGGLPLEVLEPVEDGTVARYLDRNGPGIHHVAFATPDIEGALDRARSMGITPVDDEPRPGHGATRWRSSIRAIRERSSSSSSLNDTGWAYRLRCGDVRRRRSRKRERGRGGRGSAPFPGGWRHRSGTLRWLRLSVT